MVEPKRQPRFWSYMKVGSPEECWPWQRGKCRQGYGFFRPAKYAKSLATHRIAYTLVNGPIPDGMCVMHACDNPPCCNPAHLKLGTLAENNADRKRKGRNGDPSNTGFSRGAAQGSKNRHAKITEADVVDIRKAVAEGATQMDMARKYGIAPQNIWNLIHRRTWTHVP